MPVFTLLDQISPGSSIGCHSLRIHMTSWLRSTWLHWSGTCNNVALAWRLKAVTGCTSCLWRTVKLLEFLKSNMQNRIVLQVENRKGRQHSVGLCCGPFQVHDIYYRCMIYTIVYTIVYIIVYIIVYTMIYTMIYSMVYNIYHDIYACICLIDLYFYIRGKVAQPMKEHGDLPLGIDTKANMC